MLAVVVFNLLSNSGKYLSELVKMAVKIPVVIKTPVATIDLTLILLMPQTPCPDVHPLPIAEPNPTRKPPTMGRSRGTELQSKNA